MLTALHISNFALIENLDVEFMEGFSTITGETGAGKSIILGAIDLLRGKRAETRYLRHKDKKAIIEATFRIAPGSEIARYLEDNNFDVADDGVLILRRDLSPSGRSRAFINDTPANLTTMEELSGRLLDVHSQHQTQAIVSDPKVRLKFIDALSHDDSLLTDYRKSFGEYVALRNKVRRLRTELEEGERQRESLNFKLRQLEKLNPRIGEQQELETRYKILSSAGEIKAAMEEIQQLLGSSYESAIPRMERALGLMRKNNIDSLKPELEPSLSNRLDSALIDLKDIYSELEDMGAVLEYEPSELQKIEHRLNEIYEAQLTFKLKYADELPLLKSDIETQLQQGNIDASELKSMETELKTRGAELRSKAEKLTTQRTATAASFSETLEQSARSLGLPNLRFKAQLVPAKLSADGADNVEFLCAFNKNQEFLELQHTASGGEASRLMLSMKGIIAGETELPTLIFDEIDTGISGEIAAKAASMMSSMGERLQVIAITHLPQVAARAQNQYKVFKTDDDIQTTTQIKRLDAKERETEIAKMLSGSTLDNAALKNARALLSDARKK